MCLKYAKICIIVKFPATQYIKEDYKAVAGIGNTLVRSSTARTELLWNKAILQEEEA